MLTNTVTKLKCFRVFCEKLVTFQHTLEAVSTLLLWPGFQVDLCWTSWLTNHTVFSLITLLQYSYEYKYMEFLLSCWQYNFRYTEALPQGSTNRMRVSTFRGWSSSSYFFNLNFTQFCIKIYQSTNYEVN